MSTPLSDPDNVMMVLVEDAGGFSDDEVQRILNGQPLVASAANAFHLPGRHNQETHGHDHAGGDGASAQKSSGKPLKVTHVLVHKKHESGTTIAITSDGKKRVRWDGKQYELQQKSDDGQWNTEKTAIKSKAYKAIADFGSDWTEPSNAAESDDNEAPTTPASTPEPVVAPEPERETTPEPEPEPEVAPEPEIPVPAPSTSTDNNLLQAYNEGHTVVKQFTGGFSGSTVELLELSDGEKVVRKITPEGKGDGAYNHGNTTKQEFLAGRVLNAISEDDTNSQNVARVNGNTLLMTYVPGNTGADVFNETIGDKDPAYVYGSKAKAKAAYKAEIKRQIQLESGKKIALLDYLTNNLDRHELNWITDGDEVKPIDQGFAFGKSLEIADAKGVLHEITPQTPFVEYWLGVRRNDNGYGSKFVKPKISKAELARHRASIEALKPEFDREGQSEWHAKMMERFEKLEAGLTK